MNTLCEQYHKELESEVTATRKCLERVPMEKASWKPHEKSMSLGDLANLISEMPRWISTMVEKSEIDFVTFEHNSPKSADDLAKQFDQGMEGARKALKNLTDDKLSKIFSLKNNGQVLFASPIGDNIWQTINHMAHHRGQLTVYLRLNNVPVPSIYGPSADENIF